MVPLIHWSFAVSMALAGVLYVLVHIVPRALVPLNSVPWAFLVRRASDLRYQAVLYRAFHTQRWARVSHLSLLWEQPLWFALSWVVHPVAPLVVSCVLLALASTLRSPWLVVALASTWLFSAAVGWRMIAMLGPGTTTWVAEALLVAGALLRMVGHLGEPLPPGLVDPVRFVPMRKASLRLNIVVAPLVGLVSELAASLPFRLVVVEVLWLAERMGLAPGRFGTRAEHHADALRVHREGWSGSSATAWMSECTTGSRDR